MIQSQTHFTGKNCNTFLEAVTRILPISQTRNVVRMQQIHSDTIQEVTSLQDSTDVSIDLLENTDACFTTLDTIALSVKTADCLPVFFAYKPLNLIAAAHAGRKGTQLQIVKKLLQKIERRHNLIQLLRSKNAKFKILFGPAICVNCYQVDRESDTHYDLIKENKKQILNFFSKNKVSENKIEFSINPNCTLHNNQKYYSYRNSGPGVKMNYSFIWNSANAPKFS